MTFDELSNQEKKNMAYAHVKYSLELLKDIVAKATPYNKEDFEKIDYYFENYKRAVEYEQSL